MSKKYITDFRGEMCLTPDGKVIIKQETITPIGDFGEYFNFLEDDGQLRKSMSMNDIATIEEELVNLKLTDCMEDVYNRRRKQSCVKELSKNKFVSMAEAIYCYERDTPDRFHTGKSHAFMRSAKSGPHALTRPQSPMLRCKGRARTRYILSQVEKEELEIAEIKKLKIKANPIPKSVIEGSKNLPEVPKKPITVPVPFHLTEIQKKFRDISSKVLPKQINNFKARPVPKHIFDKANNIAIKQPAPSTKAVSPKFYHKQARSVGLGNNVLKKHDRQPEKKDKDKNTVQHHGPVKPKPFSFEKRDEQLKCRKEMRIKCQLEEQRKLASQFKAQPIPPTVTKRMQCSKSARTALPALSENKENGRKLQVKPTGLYKKPFKPVLRLIQAITTVPFELTTEKRAVEREQFDKHLKEKEEETERLRLKYEREQQEIEEKAVRELRAKLVYHAKPIPSLIPNLPEKSVAPITIPNTPKLLKRLMKQNNKNI